MTETIYLDNNATTACEDEVIEAMLPFFGRQCGNPSSPHPMGRHAHRACVSARNEVAELLECLDSEVLFTSGATESNNMVLQSFAATGQERCTIVTSDVEHKSVLEPSEVLRKKGLHVVTIPVDSNGRVDVAAAEEYVHEDTALVSVQAANNEVGVLQPIERIAEIAHSRGALFHCDAAQWVGKLPHPDGFGFCDYLSFSAHKLYGPKGVGVLVARGATARGNLRPILYGGGQEDGLRAGTLNVPGIVGLGHACQLVRDRLPSDLPRISNLRASFEALLCHSLPEAWVNGLLAARLPGTCSLTVPGVPATMLVANLPRLCVGEGAACNSGAPEPSHVLLAMGLAREDADCTIRISFGRHNTQLDAEQAAAWISEEAIRLRGELSSSTHAPRAYENGSV